jgi:hypothetical protein
LRRRHQRRRRLLSSQSDTPFRFGDFRFGLGIPKPKRGSPNQNGDANHKNPQTGSGIPEPKWGSRHPHTKTGIPESVWGLFSH